jgi:hypothetical protein
MQEEQQNIYDVKYDIYLIHDNGGLPFSVMIDEQNKRAIVKIYDYDSNYETSSKEEPVILDTKFERYFLGGPLSEKMKREGGYNFEWGNSILLHIKDDEYIEIGYRIYAFTSQYLIIEYISPIGNNDVPYPYAKSAHETFLMIEDAVLDNDALKVEAEKYPEQAYCPYRLYYRHGEHIFLNKTMPIKRKINPTIIQERL